jgi:hypothetical protein
MRKISILEENYMALEQSIATVIDGAEEKISTARKLSKSNLETALGSINGENFRQDPAFINFKADANIEGMLSDIDSKLKQSVTGLKEKQMMDISKVAVLSKAYEILSGKSPEDYEDEVDELTFFFGKQNSNIPDDGKNEFKLTFSDAGYSSALEKYTEMRELFESLSDVLKNTSVKEEFYEAMDKLVVLKELAYICAE